MTGIKQAKTLLAIAAITTVLAVSTIAIGNGRMALAAETTTTTVTKNLNNTGVNVQTETNQPQNCQTVGGNSGISGSCTASSIDTVTQSGGILKK